MTPAEQKIADGVENTTVRASSKAAKGSITITWTRAKGYKVDKWEIFRSTEKGKFGDEPFFTKKAGSGRTASYRNNKSLKKGVRYYYHVRGVRMIDGKPYYTKWATAYRIAK